MAMQNPGTPGIPPTDPQPGPETGMPTGTIPKINPDNGMPKGTGVSTDSGMMPKGTMSGTYSGK